MVNRVADKESAKSILKHNGNQAAMIGMEILYTIISALTVTTMMAAFSAAAVSIYGTTLVSLVVSFINDLSRASSWGYYSPSMIFSPFKFILMALLFVLLVAATGIVTEMLKAPFEVARYRYYLYLRKCSCNGDPYVRIFAVRGYLACSSDPDVWYDRSGSHQHL